jgi:hypothetical protein
MGAIQHTSHPSSSSVTLSRRAAVGRLAAGAALATVLAVPHAARAAAQASPAPTRQEPTLYTLNGDGVEVEYATTTFAGETHLTYRGPAGDLDFSGDQVDIVDSVEFGKLVTVMIEAVPDGWTLHLTLLLPEINLIGSNEPTPFATLAIVTKRLTTIAGPGLIEGAIREYEALELQGTASFVVS